MDKTALLNKNILPNGLIKIENNRYLKIINNGFIFYSYSIPVIVAIADKPNKTIIYRTNKFYSVTTSRHINNFLREYFSSSHLS